MALYGLLITGTTCVTPKHIVEINASDAGFVALQIAFGRWINDIKTTQFLNIGQALSLGVVRLSRQEDFLDINSPPSLPELDKYNVRKNNTTQ